jgi:phosphoglycolate phosphatase
MLEEQSHSGNLLTLYLALDTRRLALDSMHICLLDIDGTLLLTGGAGQTAFAQTLAAEFDIPAINSNVLFAGRSDRAIVTDLFRAHGIEPFEENWQRFRTSYLSRLGNVLTQLQGRVLPGVNELLISLAARGDVALGLLTGNVREGARQKLVHYNLWHWFPFGGFGDDHVERNNIAAAALVAAKLHLNALSSPDHGEVVVIGDTLNDITCGRSIGARCVAVATGHSPTSELSTGRPDVLLETLEDAEPILALFDTPNSR